MRPALIVLPLVALTACATPREQCINDVTRETRILGSLIAETEGNIARGYALAERQQVRTIDTRCSGSTPDGDEFTFPCTETQTFTSTVPMAIDLNAERAKLASLQERYGQLQATSNQAVAQCIRVHPE
jgi:hypothetical protein